MTLAHDLALQFMHKEIIVDGLILEDFILIQETLKNTELPIGDLQKYTRLTEILHKVNAIVQAFEE